MSNQEAVDMVVDIILREGDNAAAADDSSTRGATSSFPSSSDEGDNIHNNNGGGGGSADDGPFQEAAERLAVEAYVRGSTDNIGVCVVAVD